MIAVIADDLTGAAEIGGIGVRQGYNVTILIDKVDEVDSEILIIATNTRSQNSLEAGRVMDEITKALLKLNPDLIYKKLDSVLRGNVAEELISQLKASNMPRALVIPSNPALNRIIKNGIYYINGVPLKDYPISGSFGSVVSSSEVKDFIREERRHFTTVASTEDALPNEGLIIGNTKNENDLQAWVEKIDGKTIPAGSSGFFNSILQARTPYEKRKQLPMNFGKKFVYVCGSAFAPSRKLVQNAMELGQEVIFMPEDIFDPAEASSLKISQWTDEILQKIATSDKVILAVNKIRAGENRDLGQRIKEAFAAVLLQLVEKTTISELVIEGGATAYSIIQKLGYTRFIPVQELGPGVIRMKVEENKHLHLTLKPGSYQWPTSIWQY